jgi:hypothetical protein
MLRTPPHTPSSSDVVFTQRHLPCVWSGVMAQIPLDEEGNRLCLWCGAPIIRPSSRISRGRVYCTRNHRKFAETYREAVALRRMGHALGSPRFGSGGEETV